jgi:hypothetical protein
MKYSKNIIKLTTMALLMTGFHSCLKPNKATFTDFSTTEDNVIIVNSGLSNLGKAPANIVVAAATTDTIPVEIMVQLASKNLNQESINITLEIDDSYRTAYNTKEGKAFIPFPDSIYSLPNKTVTIKPGTNFGTTTLYVYKPKVDLAKSFMLPVIIKDASGKKLSSNFNTQYFNIIGNPLAGPYKWTFRRYNGPDSTVALHSLSFVDADIVLLPASETQFTATAGYFIQPRYEVDFVNTAGTFSDFKVQLNADDVATMVANGVTVTDGPNILYADPVAKRFIFQFAVMTSGGPRYVIDDYHQ